MRFSLIIFFSAFTFFYSCQRNLTSSELIDKFYSHKTQLDSLVSSLHSNKKLDSIFHDRLDKGLPDSVALYTGEFNLIKKTGLTEISSCPVCPRCPRWYYIKTDWLSEYPIYLIHHTRDSTETRKGFYKKDEYKNETWGLGDNWKMFRFVDTIRNIKY